MAANKTVPTGDDVGAFVESIDDPTRQGEARTLVEVMSEVTGEPAAMWGSSIVGFGSQHLTYPTGRELDFFRVGFSPRKAQCVMYLSGGFDRYQDLFPRLGKYSTGKGCLYLKKVADADPAALRELVARSYQWTPAD